MPPPSSGGVHVIEIANILEAYPLSEQGFNSAASIHEIAEAENHAFADRARYLGDPDFVKIPVRGLTSKEYAARLRAEISPDRARPAKEIAADQTTPYESDQTTHFSVVDESGNAVSNTYTLNIPYGCGLVVEGAGFLLNNELDDFTAKAGDRALDTVDHGLNVAEAEAAPRIHHQWLPDELRVERGISKDTLRLLEAKGHKVVLREPMVSAYSIARRNGELMGAADSRHRGSLALGY
jgi:gamma-glutamyltranspeptidase/glutathione hydrolase